MTDSERVILDAAIAWVVWANKVPSPTNYSEEYDRRHEALGDAVQEHLGRDRWWAETYAPEGWPEEVPA